MDHRLSFDRFELDRATLRLFRDGVAVKLSPQPAKVLALLAERAGRVVTRDELRRALWGDDTHVDFDGSLHSCVKQIRGALGDDASAPRFVETLPRRGYRFLPEVRETSKRGASPLQWGLAALVALSVATLTSVSGQRDLAPPDAVDALLKARYHLAKREPESLEAAERFFLQAIRLDVDYVEAHAGLAEVHLERAVSSGEAGEYEAAIAASERALALEPSAEAEFLRAMGLWYGRWDWEGAGEAFERAIREDPELARAHHWYAYYLTGLGRHAEALVEIERARELDPLSPSVQSDVGWFYFFAGRYQEALAASRRTLELEPGFLLAEDCIVESYLALGKPGRALDEASSFAGESFASLDDVWRSHLASRRGPYVAGLAALRLGLVDEALEHLGEAVARRSLWLPVLRVDPRWSSARKHPRLAELTRAVTSAGRT